jgi:hypothetical protein
LVELDTIYNVSMNLIRLSRGRAYATDPFGNPQLYPTQKIERIKRENPQIGSILERFYSNKLRNAFAHSKYRILDDFIVKTDENWKVAIPDFLVQLTLCRTYWSYLKYKMVEGIMSLYDSGWQVQGDFA